MSEQQNNIEVTALVTRITGGTASSGAHAAWLVKTMMQGSDFPGFVSAEIIPPESPELNWTLVQRFKSSAQIKQLRNSEMQKKLIEELRAANGGSDTGLTQEECSHFGTRGNVTTAIVTHVKPGKELEYRQWEEKIQVAQTASAGYQGSFLQPPTGGDTGMWVTLLRFDAPESLERWFKSAARSQLLNEAEQLVQSTDIRKVTSSFPGWVPVDDKGNGPPNWKTFLLVLLGLYPIVTLEIRFLMSHLAFLPHPVANLIGNAISVALTTWVTMPLFIKWFGPWLFAPKESASSDQMKWIAIVIASFAAALACMWNVL